MAQSLYSASENDQYNLFVAHALQGILASGKYNAVHERSQIITLAHKYGSEMFGKSDEEDEVVNA